MKLIDFRNKERKQSYLFVRKKMVANAFQDISIVRLVCLFVCCNKEKLGTEVEAGEIDKNFVFYELFFY